MSDKQLSIPGLDSPQRSSGASSSLSDKIDKVRISSLEKKVISLEIELAILRIQVELGHD